MTEIKNNVALTLTYQISVGMIGLVLSTSIVDIVLPDNLDLLMSYHLADVFSLVVYSTSFICIHISLIMSYVKNSIFEKIKN